MAFGSNLLDDGKGFGVIGRGETRDAILQDTRFFGGDEGVGFA